MDADLKQSYRIWIMVNILTCLPATEVRTVMSDIFDVYSEIIKELGESVWNSSCWELLFHPLSPNSMTDVGTLDWILQQRLVKMMRYLPINRFLYSVSHPHIHSYTQTSLHWVYLGSRDIQYPILSPHDVCTACWCSHAHCNSCKRHSSALSK